MYDVNYTFLRPVIFGRSELHLKHSHPRKRHGMQLQCSFHYLLAEVIFLFLETFCTSMYQGFAHLKFLEIQQNSVNKTCHTASTDLTECVLPSLHFANPQGTAARESHNSSGGSWELNFAYMPPCFYAGLSRRVWGFDCLACYTR